jgi:uncharacterized membrane protein
MNKNSFRWRAFVSFFLLLTFLLSALSGVVLFLRPEGSLASWTGWAALGLDKKGWEGLHVVAIFFFLLFALIHLACNWRILLAYCRRRRDQAAGSGRFRELLAALLLFSLLLAGTLGMWRPLRWIVDLRAWFKGGAAVVAAAPPAADAEKLTLAALCPLLGFRGDELLENARRKRLRVESLSQTVAEVAKLNGSTPEKVFILLKAR